MTGFLNGKNARQFMDELWALLLSAQESETGIPEEFIQQKKDEILRREEDNKQFDRDREKGDVGDSENVSASGTRLPRFRPKDDNSRESSMHRQLGTSPSPGPRKQSADSTSVPDKVEESFPKSKRSPSVEKAKENSGKISSSRQRSRERSTDKSKARQKSPEQLTQSRRHSRSNSRHRHNSRRRSSNRYRNSRSRSRSKSARDSHRSSRKDKDTDKPKVDSKSQSEHAKKRRNSEERKSEGKGPITNIQAKLINLAEGRKKNNRSASSASKSGSSRSRSR